MSADARFQANLQKLFASVVKGGTLRVKTDGAQFLSSTPKMLSRLTSMKETWRTQYVFVDNKQLIITDESDESAPGGGRGAGAGGGSRKSRASKKTQPQPGNAEKHRREIELKSITQITPREDNFQFEVTYSTREQLLPKPSSMRSGLRKPNSGMGLRKKSSGTGLKGNRKSGRKNAGNVAAAAAEAAASSHHSRVSSGAMDTMMLDGDNGRARGDTEVDFAFDIDEEMVRDAERLVTVMFRASDSAEAASWVNSLNRAVQIYNSDFGQASNGVMLREYSSIQKHVDIWKGRPKKKKTVKIDKRISTSSKNSTSSNRNSSGSDSSSRRKSKGKSNRRSESDRTTLRSGASMMDLRTSKLLRPLGATQFLDEVDEHNVTVSKSREYEAWGREYIGYAGMARVRKVLVTVMSLFMLQVGALCYSVMGAIGWPTRYMQELIAFLESAWFGMFLLITGCDVNLHITPDSQLPTSEFKHPRERPKLIICNHTSQVDALYIWMLAGQCTKDRTGHVKLLATPQVAELPMMSTGLQLLGFPFLSSHDSWASDRARIRKTLRYFSKTDFPLWLVVFPEGTTINKETMEHGQRLTRNTINVRPDLSLTLMPRAREFSACLRALEEYDPEVFDMTMAFESYSGEVPESLKTRYERDTDVNVPSLETIFDGSAGRNVFLDVRRFSLSDVMEHAGGIQGWLDGRWSRKERFLDHFIKHRSFPVEDTSRDEEEQRVRVKGSAVRFGLVVICWCAIVGTVVGVLVLSLRLALK